MKRPEIRHPQTFQLILGGHLAAVENHFAFKRGGRSVSKNRSVSYFSLQRIRTFPCIVTAVRDGPGYSRGNLLSVLARPVSTVCPVANFRFCLCLKLGDACLHLRRQFIADEHFNF